MNSKTEKLRRARKEYYRTGAMARVATQKLVVESLKDPKSIMAQGAANRMTTLWQANAYAKDALDELEKS